MQTPPIAGRSDNLPQLSTHPPAPKSGRFYRPELDAIRFTAFIAVFFFHAPAVPRLKPIQDAGSIGLPLFFFLSAFLITELLTREREKTGTIHLKAFYIRRSLRIWPLYFAGVLTAILWSHYVERFRLSHREIAYLLLLFFGFMGKEFHYNPGGVLWSVSVEEIFYLIWPVAGKFRAFGWACLLLFVCANVTILSTTNVWYNPLSQFFYFSAGGLLALAAHRVPPRLAGWHRAGLLVVSVCAFAAGSRLPFEIPRFFLGALGCAALTLSCLNIDPKRVPRPLIFLGKISYGLYVFHLSCLVLVASAIDKLPLQLGASRRAVLIQCLALLFCTAAAALSYRYFEAPFLRLKRRFEFVASRPV